MERQDLMNEPEWWLKRIKKRVPQRRDICLHEHCSLCNGDSTLANEKNDDWPNPKKKKKKSYSIKVIDNT